jgi:hypothetical protein
MEVINQGFRALGISSECASASQIVPNVQEVAKLIQASTRSSLDPVTAMTSLLALHVLSRDSPVAVVESKPLPYLALERLHLQLCAATLGSGGGSASAAVLPALCVFFASFSHSLSGKGKQEGSLRSYCATALDAIKCGVAPNLTATCPSLACVVTLGAESLVPLPGEGCSGECGRQSRLRHSTA